MKKADVITSIVLLVLSGLMIWEAYQMPPSATFGPGAGFLPIGVGLVLAILATILLVEAWRRPGDLNSKSPFPAIKPLIRVVLLLVGLMAYISLIEVIGFLVDTFLYVTFLMWVVEREKWQKSLAVAVLTTAGLYIIFQTLLGIKLPSNMFVS